jgi:hypothetical protein
MSEPEPKGNSKPPGTFREVDGFGKPESKPDGLRRSRSRRDPSAVPPLGAVSGPGAVKPAGEQRKRHRRITQPLSEPERVLVKDAAAQARQLKRKHRALYTADSRRFRKIVRLAQSAVFRQKPGPKPDRKAARRIAHAARRRARGAKWEELYQQFIPDYGKLNAVTRSDAGDGFRRKVNKYLQSHGRLREAG